MSNITMQSQHGRIMNRVEIIRRYFILNPPTDIRMKKSLLNIRYYLSHVAGYLDTCSYDGYNTFVGVSCVIIAINNIAKRVPGVKPVSTNTRVATLSERCDCGGIYIWHVAGSVCRTCGMQRIEHKSEILTDCSNTAVNDASAQRISFIRKHINYAQGSGVKIPADVVDRAKRYICNPSYAAVSGWIRRDKIPKYLPKANCILYDVCGYRPPQLTGEELKNIYDLFDLLFNVLATMEPTRSICYRYYLFKIIENILPPDARTNEILSAIHLPKSNTLIKLDDVFYKVCRVIDSLTYTPTESRARVDMREYEAPAPLIASL